MCQNRLLNRVVAKHCPRRVAKPGWMCTLLPLDARRFTSSTDFHPKQTKPATPREFLTCFKPRSNMEMSEFAALLVRITRKWACIFWNVSSHSAAVGASCQPVFGEVRPNLSTSSVTFPLCAVGPTPSASAKPALFIPSFCPFVKMSHMFFFFCLLLSNLADSESYKRIAVLIQTLWGSAPSAVFCLQEHRRYRSLLEKFAIFFFFCSPRSLLVSASCNHSGVENHRQLHVR